MNILIPMAGRGSRFLKEIDKNPEYAKPKPLITIAGKTMIEWTLSSFPIKEKDQLIFLVLKEHVNRFNIDEKLKNIFGDEIKIIVIDELTEGPACTVLLAKEFINNEQPLLITDADHYIDGKKLFDDIDNLDENIAGIITVFYANNSKWSFSKIDEKGYVVEVAEKIQISRNASSGGYYFSKGRDFVWAAEEMIEENDRTNDEFYVAPVYNYMIRRGKLIILSRSRFFHGLGTPKEADKFMEFLERGEIEHNFQNLLKKKNIDKSEINVVIPFAGKDERFDIYNDIKPLININGKPLIKHCTDSLEFFNTKRKIYFIMLKEHEEKYNIKQRLEQWYKSEHDINFLILDEMTEGSACTVLKLKDKINNNNPLVVYLADVDFQADLKNFIENSEADGLVPTFKSSREKYSYLKLENPLNLGSKAIEVAEKKVISNHASAGFYYFKHGKDFVLGSEEMIRKNLRVNNSFYICPVYQELIESGKIVKIIPSEFGFSLGSPEEVAVFKEKKSMSK